MIGIARIQSMLDSATYELEQMMLHGLGGGFVEGAINSEKVLIMVITMIMMMMMIIIIIIAI